MGAFLYIALYGTTTPSPGFLYVSIATIGRMTIVPILILFTLVALAFVLGYVFGRYGDDTAIVIPPAKEEGKANPSR